MNTKIKTNYWKKDVKNINHIKYKFDYTLNISVVNHSKSVFRSHLQSKSEDIPILFSLLSALLPINLIFAWNLVLSSLSAGLREDSQIDFFRQSVFGHLRGGGEGGVAGGRFKKSVKNRFLTKQIFF